MKLFRRLESRKPTLFVFPSIGGPAPYFWNLQSALGDEVDLVQLARSREPDRFPCHPDEVCQLHLEQIRAVQPSGPYYLIGHSYGAQAAFYSAVALQNAGDDVAFVCLLDDEADVHRRRFDINAAHCSGIDPVAAGRHVVDLNPLYRYSGKLTLIKADLWSGARSPGPACDWEFLADGGVDVFTHPYTHMSIVSVPAIKAWVPELRVALRRAHGQPAGYTDCNSPTFVPPWACDIPQKAFDAFRASKCGDIAVEIEGYRAALAIAPQAPDWIAINLAAALRQNGQTEDAISLLRSIVQGTEVMGNAHYELAALLSVAGRHPERARLADDIASMPCISASDWHFRGILMEVCQSYSDSVAAYRKAFEICPGRSDSRLRCASLLQREDRFQEAGDVVEQGLELDPDSGFLRVILGEVQAASGNKKEAEATFRRVIEADTSQARAVLSLARMMMDDGRLSEADDLIKECLKRHAKNHAIYLIHAELQLLLGRNDRAETAFRQAISSQNQDIRAWIGLAKLVAESGRPSDALELLRSAPQQVRQNGAVRMQAGDIALASSEQLSRRRA